MANCCDNCSNIELPVGPTGAQGPQGNPGTNGTNGTTILFNEPAERGSNTTYVENTLTTNEQILAPFIPADTMENDGDLLEIDAVFYLNKSASGNDIFFNIELDGNTILTNTLLRRDVIECIKLKFYISRNGDNSVSVLWDSHINKFFGGLNSSSFNDGMFSLIIPTSVTGLDFTNNIPITVNCLADGAGLFRISQFTGTLKFV